MRGWAVWRVLRLRATRFAQDDGLKGGGVDLGVVEAHVSEVRRGAPDFARDDKVMRTGLMADLRRLGGWGALFRGWRVIKSKT